MSDGHFVPVIASLRPEYEFHTAATVMAESIATQSHIEGVFLRGSAFERENPAYVWDIDLVVITDRRLTRLERQEVARCVYVSAEGIGLAVGLDITIISAEEARTAVATELGLSLAFRSVKVAGTVLWPEPPCIRPDRALAEALSLDSLNWIDQWLNRHSQLAHKRVAGNFVSVFQKRTLRLAKFFSLPESIYSRNPIDCAYLFEAFGPDDLKPLVKEVRDDFERGKTGVLELDRCGSLYIALHEPIQRSASTMHD